MKAIITNQGFKVRALYVPPFDLYQGEYLSLNFPDGYDHDEETLLVEILTGRKDVPEVKVLGHVSFVSPDFKTSFFTFLNSKKVFSLLKENTSLSEDKINTVLDVLEIKGDVNLQRLGFNEKIFLALEITYSNTKNVIINCSGLDYSGLTKLRERILPELNAGSVIELNYLNSKGREYLLDSANSKGKIIDLRKV